MDSISLCPICSKLVPFNPRYPEAVCSDCRARAVDALGRPIQFFNENLTGGLLIQVKETGELLSSSECWIDGVACEAREAYMGGVVIQPTVRRAR